MDASSTTTLIEHHMTALSESDVHDEPSAHQALAHAMAAVEGINQGLSPGTGLTTAVGGPVDDIIKKLEEWIKLIVDKLTAIVKQIAGETTFSITVGPVLSVTINFGPFK